MKKGLFTAVALLSITLIGLELIWTRIFSAEFFYTFAFLILSLALLGLGIGALAVRLAGWNEPSRYAWLLLLLSAIMAVAGPIAVFRIGLDFSKLASDWLMAAKLLLTIILLSTPFFFGGMALALIFKNYHREISRVYMADLAGAATGVLLSVLAMNYFGAPPATFLITLPMLIAAFLMAASWRKALPVIAAAGVILLSFYATPLLEKPQQERAPVIYKHWDAMSKIKIYEYDPDSRGLNIDNAANSPVYRFDGNWNRPDSLRFQFGIDVSNLIHRFDTCRFLSLGAGGGADVLQALQENAAEIHAVEVNPQINALMQDGLLADFSGRIYHDPRVKVVTEDARAYVRRFENKFDVIYSLSSNTFAALASGAFAMAENYLFTTGAFRDYWRALSDSGFMMMEHQFYAPRMVSELMQALEEEGVNPPTGHFAVYNLPQMRRKMLLISKRPLNDEIRNHAFGELSQQVYKQIHLLYPCADSLQANIINRIVTEGWQKTAAVSPVDLSPCDDNRPFAAQLGLWKNFKWLDTISPYEFFGFPLAKLIIILVLLIILVIILPLNLVPFLTGSERLRAAPWLYFFAIGMGFMTVEVILIQKYALFIGPSVYSFSTILLSLLLGSALGSRFAPRFSARAAFAGITICILMNILAMHGVFQLLGGLEIAGRILVSAALLLPLGFFMGMPFPMAAARTGELIDWGFAVNGAASVFGSALSVLIAFVFGFNAALGLALILYVLAFALISGEKAWN
jgi:hypothetical protein